MESGYDNDKDIDVISLKQLSYALAIEKTLHFKKAAEQCHISQSALSSGLSDLEEKLGVQILERDNKKVLVTDIGKEVLKRAHKIMLEVHELEHLSDRFKPPLSFPLSLGIIPTVAPFILPKLMSELKITHPKSNIAIIEEQTAQLLESLRGGTIDAAVIALPYPCEGLEVLEFWEEDFYWICLKDHKFAHQKHVSSKQVAESNLMLLSEGHCFKDHALDVCDLKHQFPQPDLRASHLNTLIQMVLGNMGNTLIPEIAKEQLTNINSNLRAVHLNEPGPHRRLAFVIRPNYTQKSSILELIEVCKRTLM
ncbi:transcriptional regulator, LysR family [Marinomonas mediterranea MMB-1]|uniref:Transcriptional regulator, LysR family n=1 Tax=Marinomonas mediterranea (strain ATCC 700492 / JCM 21426 / NBRC 103028 / MMB-1) TaxID=717774 RepID=F2JX02_MARM1|nr:transcriptional regulator, LysR family [Marinomonas mediterranea MMB-1]